MDPTSRSPRAGNGFKNVRYSQGYSETGWFPFRFARSNVTSKGIVDTPDINYNPVSRRLEVAVPHRDGDDPGPAGGMKVNLYSIFTTNAPKRNSQTTDANLPLALVITHKSETVFALNRRPFMVVSRRRRY